MVNLQPVHGPMIAILEYHCEPIDDALLICLVGATVLGGALSLLFIFLLIGLKAFAVGNQDDRGGKYTQAG